MTRLPARRDTAGLTTHRPHPEETLMPKLPKRTCGDSHCGYTARWGLHFVAKSGASTMAAVGNDPVQVSCGQHLPILLELLQFQSPFVAVTDLRKAVAS